MTQPQPLRADAAPRDVQGCREASPSRPPVDSAELLRGARCVEIRHNGEVYRLQATRLGKLILTK